MEQRISLITLGVSDLSRARSFYECLGWHGQEIEATVFFQAGGLGLVLWLQDKLAEDAGAELGEALAFAASIWRTTSAVETSSTTSSLPRRPRGDRRAAAGRDVL